MERSARERWRRPDLAWARWPPGGGPGPPREFGL